MNVPVAAVEAAAAAAAQRQLDAYNAQDLDAFLACYATDCEALLLATGERRCRGHAEMRRIYGALFANNPRLECRLKSRSTMGRFVFDEEELQGYADGSTRRAMAIYEVDEGLIRKIWFVAP